MTYRKRAEGEASTEKEENGSVNVGFDFHLKTSRLNRARLWLAVLALGGALGLVATVLQAILKLWAQSIGGD